MPWRQREVKQEVRQTQQVATYRIDNSAMKVLRCLLRLTCYLLISSGFGYQAFHICSDYFRYTTSSHISILSDPPRKYIPTILICSNVQVDIPVYVDCHDLFSKYLSERINIVYAAAMEKCHHPRV